jgi:uncharacterized protein YjbI with pentapeptide repeats
MRATEVLNQYAAGRRDFSGEDLRGQSFQGKDLSGANFTNSKLIGANFSRAKAGLQRRWAIVLVLASWILSALSGIFSLFIGVFLGVIFDENITNGISNWVAFILVAVFFVITIRKGLVTALRAVAYAYAYAFAFTCVGVGLVAVSYAYAYDGAVAFAGNVAGVVGGAFVVGGAVVVAGVVAYAFAVAFAFLHTYAFAVAIAEAGFVNRSIPRVVAIAVVSFAVVLLNAYISWRALKGGERDAWIRTITIAFAATGGTSFRRADLTDADFTSATLKNTDFRNATFTRTNLHQTKKLDLARVGNTILMDAKVRDLIVTHRGAKQSYKGCNLKGANLIGANLNDADLTEADISDANLQQAWLERANLTKTQALNSNFNQAHLTGACLEDWNINSTTKLDGAICEYVYLLNNHQERRLNSGEFAPGEFTRLFQQVLNTVDLIFCNGIDWKAFFLSFNAVQAKNADTELSLKSIADKGDGIVVARFNVSGNTDKKKIHSDFMESYKITLKAVEKKYKAKLNAKDEQIKIYRKKSSDMKEIVRLLANRTIVFEVKDSTGALNLGEISGTVADTINQLPPSPEPEKPGIKELLVQLQAAINDPNLADDDKTQVLEQIKVLAEAGQNPNKEIAQKQAKRAMGFLKVIAEGLPSAAQLMKTCQYVLPAIAHFFGL